MREFELPAEFDLELDRIIGLLDHDDEIVSYPKVITEAPRMEFRNLPEVVHKKYQLLLKEAQRFQELS